MDRISFDIYIPDGKKFHLTPDWIVYGLWFIILGFFWAFDRTLPNSGDYRGYAAGILVIVSLYYLITSWWTYKPLNGRLEGKIILNDNDVNIDGITYQLRDITNIDFSLQDYYGKSTSSGRGFSPKLYQGVNNYISFTDKNNTNHLVYFKLQIEHSYLSLSTFINQAIKLNKMPMNRGIGLLGIENVSIN